MKLFIITLHVLVVIICLLHLQSCDPDRPSPEDKFYCKVNGEHWKNHNGGDFKLTSLYGEVKENKKFLRIYARNATTDETIIVSIVDSLGIDFTKNKVYTISTRHIFPANPPSAYYIKSGMEHSTSLMNKGTFRLVSAEMKGTDPVKITAEFEFTAANTNGEIVHVTNGKFNNSVRISQ